MVDAEDVLAMEAKLAAVETLVQTQETRPRR